MCSIKPHNVLMGEWTLAHLLSTEQQPLPEVRVADLGIAMQLDDKGCLPTDIKNRQACAYQTCLQLAHWMLML